MPPLSDIDLHISSCDMSKEENRKGNRTSSLMDSLSHGFMKLNQNCSDKDYMSDLCAYLRGRLQESNQSL